MKKTTTLLAAVLVAGGINAKPFPQTPPPTPAAPVATTAVAQPVATVAVAPVAEGQQPYARAQASYAQAAAQQNADPAQEYTVTTTAPDNQDPFGGGNFSYGYGGPGFSFSSTEQPHSALVIRTSETPPETLAAMKEDLNIMGHILEKAVSKSDGDDDQARAMGIRLTSFGSRSGGAKFLQIEGSGALFLLNVDFPLMGPPEKAPAEKTVASNSSAWNEAKRELYGHSEGESGPGAPREEFDSKRVDKLKVAVLEALKNAANMNHLPESETVTVVVNGGSPHGRGGFGGTVNWMGSVNSGGGLGSVGVSGGGGGGGSWAGTTSSGGGSASVSGGGGGGGIGGGGSSNGGGTATITGKSTNKGPRMADRLNSIVRPARSGSSGIMTIHVAKADIDAFANGKIDLDAFHKKAHITVY